MGLGISDSTRLSGPAAPATGINDADDRFLSEANFRRLEEIRRRRDPDGLFCSYLIADGAELNAEPDRRPYTASGR